MLKALEPESGTPSLAKKENHERKEYRGGRETPRKRKRSGRRDPRRESLRMSPCATQRLREENTPPEVGKGGNEKGTRRQRKSLQNKEAALQTNPSWDHCEISKTRKRKEKEGMFREKKRELVGPRGIWKRELRREGGGTEIEKEGRLKGVPIRE